MPQLRHYDHTGTARFVTFTCYRRYRYLCDSESRQAVLVELARLRSDHGIRILGWVLMPEHVHLVLLPPDNLTLGAAIGQLKARSARAIIGLRESRGLVLTRPDGYHGVWQRRFYDRNCRTPEEAREKIDYCHKNPVHRGLVSQPGDWPWSSYNWYAGSGNVLLEIDGSTM